MQHERNQGEAPTAVLASIDEGSDLPAHLGCGAIADQPTGALQDSRRSQHLYLRLEFLLASTKPRGESGGIQDGVGVAVEEDNDVPRQERPDMSFHELRDRGPENPL